MTPLNDLQGKRGLFKIMYHSNLGRHKAEEPVQELRVLEIAPSGDFVKLMNMDGKRFWHISADVELVEALADLSKAPPLDKADAALSAPPPFQVLIYALNITNC